MIKDRIANIKNRIELACFKSKRDISKITLIAVSKNRAIDQIQEVVDCAVINLGENKVQEALSKYKFIPTARWHMIGHLQTNKVKRAVEIFEVIQSVDRLRLIEEINKQAERINKIQDILIEVKTSPELSKSGLDISEAPRVIEVASKFKNIKINGLMTMAPYVDQKDQARQYFRKLREIRDKINKDFILSMGMSDDFEVAIEEGSDMVRIGRTIFES